MKKIFLNKNSNLQKLFLYLTTAVISTFGASYWKSGLSRIRSVSEAVRLLSLVGSCLLLLLLLDSCRGPAAASLALTVGQL